MVGSSASTSPNADCLPPDFLDLLLLCDRLDRRDRLDSLDGRRLLAGVGRSPPVYKPGPVVSSPSFLRDLAFRLPALAALLASVCWLIQASFWVDDKSSMARFSRQCRTRRRSTLLPMQALTASTEITETVAMKAAVRTPNGLSPVSGSG